MSDIPHFNASDGMLARTENNGENLGTRSMRNFREDGWKFETTSQGSTMFYHCHHSRTVAEPAKPRPRAYGTVPPAAIGLGPLLLPRQNPHILAPNVSGRGFPSHNRGCLVSHDGCPWLPSAIELFDYASLLLAMSRYHLRHVGKYLPNAVLTLCFGTSLIAFIFRRTGESLATPPAR